MRIIFKEDRLDFKEENKQKIFKCNQIFSIQQFENALSKGIFDIKSTLQIKLMH